MNDDFKVGRARFKRGNEVVDIIVREGALLTVTNWTFSDIIERMKNGEKKHVHFDFVNGDK